MDTDTQQVGKGTAFTFQVSVSVTAISSSSVVSVLSGAPSKAQQN
jgi:hypothetical protein